MKEPDVFVKSIYLHDRRVNSVVLDGRNKKVIICIDLISRVDKSEKWGFTNDRNIENGQIVFDGVHYCSIDPPGSIPDDWIEISSAVKLKNISTRDGKDLYVFTVHTASIDEYARETYTVIKITAETIYLEDPAKPNVKITD